MLRRKKIFAVLLSVLIGSSTASAIPAALAEEITPIIDSHFSVDREGWALGANNTWDEAEGAAAPGCIKIGGAFSIRRDKGGFEGDAVYRFSGKFKGSGEMVIRTEFYESIEGGFSGPLGTTGSDPFTLSEEWQEFSYTFKPLAGATAAAVYIQGKNAGVKYVDDILLVREEYIVADFEPEHVFYYTEFETGKLYLSPNTERFPELIGGKVVFSVSETGYSEEKSINSAETIESTFSIKDVLQEKGKEYKAVAKVYNKTGNLVDTKEESIHRYDRPTYIRADGIFEKNGHALDPVLMTGLSQKGDYKGAATLGPTIATAYANVSNERLNYIGDIFGDGTGETDADGAPDMYAGVALYSNNQPAGHPINMENTKARVADIKGNDNLFGYIIGEETFSHCSPETAKELLRISYKTIRDIDPNHPIYFIEITDCMYKEAVKYCDIFFPDIYPGNKNGAQGDYLARLTEKAVEIGKRSQKPVYVLHQAYNYKEWMPKGTELRNMIYRAFLEGAKGYGYYTYEKADGTTVLKDTEMGTMLEAFKVSEQKLVFDLFVRGEKKGEGETEGAVWQAITHGGKDYLVAVNRSMENSNTATLILPSGSTFRKLFGESNVENMDGFIRIPLAASEAAVYEVTVSEGEMFIGESPTLENGDMEAGSLDGTYPDGWDRVAGGTPAPVVSALYSMADAAEAHSGTACAKIGGIGGNPYVHYRTPYVHGENYEVSFYFKYKEAVQKGVPRIEVRKSIWGDVILDGVTGVTYENTIPGISAEEWVKCTYHFTAPSEGTEPLAICLFGSTDTVCCYDDVVLRSIESEGIRFLNETGETQTKKDESPAAVLGWYFPTHTSNESIMLLKGSYAAQNGTKELTDMQNAAKETNGKAVTLKIDCTTALGESEKVFFWKNGAIPIVKKTTLK